MRHGEGRKEEKDEMGFAGVVWPKEENWIYIFLHNDVRKVSNIYEVMYKKSGHINEDVMLNM